MTRLLFRSGTVVLENRLLPQGQVEINGERIKEVGSADSRAAEPGLEVIDLRGGYLVPGFVDLHLHGGDGSDFMDGTPEAFRTICKAHARHGVTSLLPTTTVAVHEKHMVFLELCQRFKKEGTGGARVLGAHFYGPYFGREAKGAHPATGLRTPDPKEYNQYLEFADSIATATVAPELPGAEGFVRACRKKGIVCTTGHSHATFDQMAAAVDWGVRHIDHLYCAHSDVGFFRARHTYPLRGGILEAVYYFDELTTEVIADGKHLARELLLLAYKLKGPDRVALVADCSRAMDMPDGEYMIGPSDQGQPAIRRDDVGLMPDGKMLASSVMALDTMVRTFLQLTGVPLYEVIRMASLTPARIAGWDHELGSITAGKLADLVILDKSLQVQQVFLAGRLIWSKAS